MPNSDDDFFDSVATDGIQNDNTAKILRTFNETLEAEEKVAELEAMLEDQKSKITKNKNQVLPDLLNEMGTSLWRDPVSGITVELETAVNSTLPKDQNRRNEILDALRPIGIEEILAEEFLVTFSPNDQRAMVLRAILGLPELNPDVLDDGTETEGRLTNRQLSLIADLREELNLGQLPAVEKLGCHPSRLKSWLKEQIENGQGTAIQDAGIWHGKAAKFVKPRAKKAK